MQITKDQLMAAAKLANKIGALESSKDKLKDEEHVFHVDLGWDMQALRVPVSAAAPRAELARQIAEASKELKALGFELLPT